MLKKSVINKGQIMFIKCPISSQNVRSHRIEAGHLSDPNFGLSHTLTSTISS